MPLSVTGPFVAMAVLCQRLDRQPDGTVDVRGVVDGVQVELPTDPHTAEPMMIPLLGVVSLRAGTTRGSKEITVRGHYPSGDAGPTVSRRVQFSDTFPNATLTVPLELEVDQEGTYWFDVAADGQLLTRISLLVHRRS
ncbi:MAG: hypothetical protein GEU99_23985 [Luteitalea sp.]|nr:hypothetical protein [Luteitalea sp.]